MKTFTIDWLNKCRCGNKSHTVKTARGNETALWDDDAVKCNSCGRGGVIQVCEGQARVLWETDEEMADGKPMTTITKERLLTIKQWRETYGPGSNVVLPAEEAEELARIALASLEAKPIGAFHIAEQQVDGTSDYLKDGEWPIDNGIIEVYAAPLVPVVPEEKPMPNPLSMYAVDAVAAIAEVRGWNACRAAMLHGAEPVSQTHKSQHTQFEQVADLYEMQFDDGRTCAFHTDAQKAAQWLQACDGNRVQEYVKLERLRNALSGNSPVIPDGLSTVCAEAYQVVGVMADALGVFGDAAVQKVLDNLSQQKLVHRDVLPFSLPVTPDGWISCSERMPKETGDIIVVSDGIVMSGISYSRRDGFYIAALEYDDDEPIGGVTHWMPLPEPPRLKEL